VPSRGSVGASGDLAPLAHLAGALLDDGLALEPKEGLALLNGTHLMAAAAALVLHDARVLLDAAELTAALSLDVLLASVAPMDDRIHAVRRRPQQRRVAARVRAAVAGSELLASHAGCGRVQDAYTLRCIPQVLGAVAEGLDYLEAALQPELAAVTDNPLCFPDDGEVVSGGNFHGQPLSLPLDLAAIALAELAGFSERRTFRLLDGRADEWALPPFLTRAPGTRSGLMLAQYTAAALVGELGVLAHPAGPTSLPTSAGQEDWNSMGATAGLKALRALELSRQVVAIELVCAAQALDLRRPLVSGPPLEELHARLRRRVAPLGDDRPPGPDLEAIAAAIAAGELAGILPSTVEG
jgi:histidine ammonia-lyase